MRLNCFLIMNLMSSAFPRTTTQLMIFNCVPVMMWSYWMVQRTGSIEVAPLVTDFSVDFFVSSASQFTGAESVALTMTQPDGTPVKATAAIADADD